MLQIEFTGKHAVVTGGGRSIGRATAELLRRCGATVVILDRNKESVRDADEQGLVGRVLDVREADAVTKVFGEIEDDHGPIDILVNCAGILQRPTEPEELAV